MRFRTLLLFVILLVSLEPSLTRVHFGANAQPAVIGGFTWGGGSYDFATAIALDSLGNRYVAGNTYSFGAGDYDIFLLKASASGALIWQRTWGGNRSDSARDVAVDSSGNVYVIGFTQSFNPQPSQYPLTKSFLLKFDSAGNLLWQRVWGGSSGGSSSGGAGGLAIDSGYLYVTGTTNVTGRGSDVYLLKLDFAGSIVWQKTWGSMGDDNGNAVAVDALHNVYVAGSLNPNNTYASALVLKVDPTGNLQWARAWGDPNYDAALGVAVDSSGSIFVSGQSTNFTKSPFISGKIFALKVDPTGGLVWQKSWGTGGGSGAGRVAFDQFGNVNIAGTIEVSSSYHVLLLTLNSTGGLVDQNMWGGGGSFHDDASGIAVEPSGHVLVVGDVGEAPPYTLSSPVGLTLSSPTFNLNASSVSPGSPNFVPTNVNGVVTTPNGSTSYAGSQDAFMFEFATLPASQLTLTLSAKTSLLGFSVMLKGQLTNSTGTPIGGLPIILEYKVPEVQGYTLITSVTTLPDESYSAEWTPSATGNFIIRARFPGNEVFYQSSTTTNLAVIPFAQTVVFSVESNVTISNLAFDSTTSTLGFAMSGPHGAVGSVNIFIAKSLIPNINGVKLSLNGTVTNFTYTENSDSFMISFTHHLSSYNVQVTGLSTSPSSGSFPYLTLLLPTLASLLAVLLAIVLVRQKRLKRDLRKTSQKLNAQVLSQT